MDDCKKRELAEVPNLFAPDEQEQISTLVRPLAKALSIASAYCGGFAA